MAATRQTLPVLRHLDRNGLPSRSIRSSWHGNNRC